MSMYIAKKMLVWYWRSECTSPKGW